MREEPDIQESKESGLRGEPAIPEIGLRGKPAIELLWWPPKPQSSHTLIIIHTIELVTHPDKPPHTWAEAHSANKQQLAQLHQRAPLRRLHRVTCVTQPARMLTVSEISPSRIYKI